MRNWNVFGRIVLCVHTLFNFEHNWYSHKGHICCACGFGKDKTLENYFGKFLKGGVYNGKENIKKRTFKKK